MFSRANDGVLVPVLYQPPRSRSRSVASRIFKFLVCYSMKRAVVISLAKAHHNNRTSIVNCLRLKFQSDVGEVRPYERPFRLHADGNMFIIKNDFLRDEKIDVRTVIAISSNGCYLGNTGDYLVSLWCEYSVGYILRALAIA